MLGLVCSDCGETKAATEFYRDRSKPSGRGAYCRPCGRERSRRYYWANQERQAEYYQENRDRIRQRNRQRYRQRNGSRVPESRHCDACGSEYTPKKHHPQNRFCSRRCRDTSSEARQRNRRKARARRARSKSVREATQQYRDEDVFARDGWRCGLCGKRIGKSYSWPHPRSVSIDHIIPVAKGGTDGPENVQAAHLSCNLAKGVSAVGEQLRLVG